MDTEKIQQALFNQNVSLQAFGETHLFEHYKICVAAAESISTRRQTANSFFVSINTILISFVSYLNMQSDQKGMTLLAISLAGIAACYMWRRLLLLYKALNGAKFSVIFEIEKRLPLQPFAAEWKALEAGKNTSLYRPFSDVEARVPIIFMLLHLVAALFYSYSFLITSG